MAILPFDTLAYSKRPQETGMPAQQADVIVNMLSEVLVLRDLATKEDVQNERKLIRAIMDIELQRLRGELKSDIERLRCDTLVEIEKVRAEIK